MQESFDLFSGPLFKMAIFRLKNTDRLFLLAHHLVTDGVSWRVLLEDFNTLYGQGISGEALELSPKTESFKAWTTELYKLAQEDLFSDAQRYWLDRLPLPGPLFSNNLLHGIKKDTKLYSFSLDKEDTHKLLSAIHHAYSTEINDILLAALTLSVAEVWERDTVCIAMEGHGRESVANKNVSRTIGWFTSIYPVILDTSKKDDLPRHICFIKDQLRAIPDKGASYGILSCLDKVPALEGHAKPEIIFNYLGQFDNSLRYEGFSFAKETMGSVSNENETIEYPVAFSGKVVDGELIMTLETDPAIVQIETGKMLTDYFRKYLLNIIRHCASQSEKQVTLSDFQYQGLTEQAFESLFD
jgi:non-ribosomal peptide synthase protein (TIGR01720 family)